MDIDPLPLQVLARYPLAWKYLDAKTFEYFQRTLTRLVRSLYNGFIGGEFVDIASNLIRGQIIDAHVRAWSDEGGDGDPPLYLQLHAQTIVDQQISHLHNYYTDIIDARINQTSIQPLLVRADMWANRYKEAYNGAVQFIAEQSGGKLEWVYGASKEHCPTCAALDGIVAFATEWATAGFKPQNAPNPMLDCEGWQCGCSQKPTKKRRTQNALDKLINIAVSRAV